MPQAAGNAVISCICAAHKKYESNPVDWQRVVEIGWCLLTKQDMERFEEMCEDGLLGPGDYGLFEDWSDINRSRDGYIRIRDGLILVGDVQEINDEENFYGDGPYQVLFVDFSWRTTRWLLIIGGSCSV
jgi:hypothetical protein